MGFRPQHSPTQMVLLKVCSFHSDWLATQRLGTRKGPAQRQCPLAESFGGCSTYSGLFWLGQKVFLHQTSLGDHSTSNVTVLAVFPTHWCKGEMLVPWFVFRASHQHPFVCERSPAKRPLQSCFRSRVPGVTVLGVSAHSEGFISSAEVQFSAQRLLPAKALSVSWSSEGILDTPMLTLPPCTLCLFLFPLSFSNEIFPCY